MHLKQTTSGAVTSALPRCHESLGGNGIVLSRKRYVLDGADAAQCWDTTGQTPVFLASCLYGPRGPECRTDALGSAIWFIYDGHGNAVGEVTEDGKVNVDGGETTTLRDYDPWGNMTTAPEDLGPAASLLQYCGALGHPSENTTGLIYMRARYYDPVLGRFISEDPARDGGNWYAYAGNNSVGMVDPDGRAAKDWLTNDLWIRWDDTKSHLHWGDAEGELGAVKAGGAISHKERFVRFPSNSEMKSIKKGGLFSKVRGLAYDTITAAMEQNPMFVIGLFLDIAGESTAADQFYGAAGVPQAESY